MDEFIRTKGTQGIVLQEYQGTYSVAAAWEGKEGKTMLKWGKEQKGRDNFAETATPIKITLGDRETAIGVLKMLLSEFTGKTPDEDVPF